MQYVPHVSISLIGADPQSAVFPARQLDISVALWHCYDVHTRIVAYNKYRCDRQKIDLRNNNAEKIDPLSFIRACIYARNHRSKQLQEQSSIEACSVPALESWRTPEGLREAPPPPSGGLIVVFGAGAPDTTARPRV